MLNKIEKHLPKLVLAPSFIAILVFVYAFIIWTAWISLTKSRLMPKYDIVGFIQYERLFDAPRWEVAFTNLFIFGFLFIAISMFLGLILAILLDQRIRIEGFIRTVYLYPMSLSLIVTGTAWKWILNPGLGFEASMKQLGFENFKFDWLINPDMAIYTVVLAGVWQASGFIMALFLAGLRSVDDEIIELHELTEYHISNLYRYNYTFDGTNIFICIYCFSSFSNQKLRFGYCTHRRWSWVCD